MVGVAPMSRACFDMRGMTTLTPNMSYKARGLGHFVGYTQGDLYWAPRYLSIMINGHLLLALNI